MNYGVNPYGMLPLFPGASDITLGEQEAVYVQADAICSTAGWGSLYALNECYNDRNEPDSCNAPIVDTPFPFDITGYQDSVYTANCAGSLPASRCVTVPPFSYGIIRIPITPITGGKEEQNSPSVTGMQVYPNPSTKFLYITLTRSELSDNRVLIFNTVGKTVMDFQVTSSSQISLDVSSLPAGMYYVAIASNSQNVLSAKFIKQ